MGGLFGYHGWNSRLFPLGSGPGTYPDVFHAFHPPELGDSFVNHVHNDYLEWLFEGFVDYNLHIPANMLYFAFLAGIFFIDPDQYPVKSTRRSRKRKIPDMVRAAASDDPGNKPARPVADQIRNPFLD